MPTVTNFLVSSLPDFVQTNRDLLLKNFGLAGTGTRSRISIQTGVKGSAALNFLDVAPVLQDGAACAFSAEGSLTLSQRNIVTAAIKSDFQICPRTLIGKYAEYLVRMNATEEELPYEEFIMAGIVGEINKKIEKLIWQGDLSATTNPDLKWIDGFLEIAGDEADVIDVEIASGKSAYEGIQAVYFALPEEVLERGASIFVSPAIFRLFMQEMVTRNYYHYNPGDENRDEFLLPGSDCRVVKTPGLAGSLEILGTFAANLYYGCDMEGDSEDIDVWYSRDDRVFKVEVLWNSGVQIAFPNMVVLGVFAATPTVQVSNADALGVIATKQTAIAADLGDIKTDIDTIATKSAGLDNLAGIKTDADKLAAAVNESNQIETHPNTE